MKKEEFFEVLLVVTIFGGWVTAVVHDARHWHDTLGWLVADIFLPPVAILRGIFIFLFGG